jgi:hypothetical protein
MDKPTFMIYDDEDNVVDLTWATRKVRLCVYLYEDEGLDIFGIDPYGIIDFDKDFVKAYAWYKEKLDES